MEVGIVRVLRPKKGGCPPHLIKNFRSAVKLNETAQAIDAVGFCFREKKRGPDFVAAHYAGRPREP